MSVWKGIVGLSILMLGTAAAGPERPACTQSESFPDVIHPADNEPSPERWALGRRLFFDPIMSRDRSISCASCHNPKLAFSDEIALSPGVDDLPGTQNAPTLANVAYHPYLTRAGGVPTLEMQILVPIQEHNEFDTNIITIAERLGEDSSYVDMSQAAYGRDPDAFVITRALACFERSLISNQSRYDLYLAGDEDAQLTELELAGKELFFSDRAMCSTCHSGFNFTDYSFRNNGLYIQYPDSGRLRFTGDEMDRARFKVPTLRNLSFTSPYMHDGSLPDIESVIEHYSNGIQPHKNLSEGLKPYEFTSQEKSQLVAFLKTLDDKSFTEDKRFQRP